MDVPSVTIWEILTAIGTVGAVVLTLLVLIMGKINEWWSRATFSISVADPVIAKTWRDPEATNDQVVTGLIFEQVSGSSSSDVECILEKIWRYDISEPERAQLWNETPITSIRWGVDPKRKHRKLTERFTVGVKRYCSLLTFCENDPAVDGNSTIWIATAETLGEPLIDAHSACLPVYNLSKWKLDLLLIGENVVPKRFSVTVSVKERWRPADDEDGYIEAIKLQDCLEVKII